MTGAAVPVIATAAATAAVMNFFILRLPKSLAVIGDGEKMPPACRRDFPGREGNCRKLYQRNDALNGRLRPMAHRRRETHRPERPRGRSLPRRPSDSDARPDRASAARRSV